MKKIKEKLSEIHILLFLKLIPYMFREYWIFTKHMARCKMSCYPEKLLTDILMTTHALEKAFSLNNPKKGFGVTKSMQPTNNIEKYISKYGYNSKLDVPISLIITYLNYQKETKYSDKKLDEVEIKIQKILSNINQPKAKFNKAGKISFSKETMLHLNDANFKTLARNRYSIRHFGKGDISEEILKEAIKIAQKSPSACNRQSYRVHIFSDKQKDIILSTQGGANSFYKEANKAILITGDLNRYYSTEMHLPYIDASLFAMSLMYALTYLGIASIPLTMGRKLSVLKQIQGMKIPQNEIPVILIAIGNYPDEVIVSQSERFSIDSFTTFH